MAWEPDEKIMADINVLVKNYREKVRECLEPLVLLYYPVLMHKDDNEYRKMIELSTKMTLVGHACTEIAGYPFDSRRQMIGSLFGGCCFLADSFIDDFGEETARVYLERFELLLTKGWFDIRNEREQLFYVITARLFAERDVLEPMIRQAIFWLFLAQKRDVELRLNAATFRVLPSQSQLALLKNCARDRGGHMIITLSRFLVPELLLQYYHLIFTAGTLFMYIDDYGDYHSDQYCNRITYINRVRYPAQTLRRIFNEGITKLREGLPESRGRDLLTAFLFRYFTTRIEKHKLERDRGEHSWAVYE